MGAQFWPIPRFQSGLTGQMIMFVITFQFYVISNLLHEQKQVIQFFILVFLIHRTRQQAIEAHRPFNQNPWVHILSLPSINQLLTSVNIGFFSYVMLPYHRVMTIKQTAFVKSLLRLLVHIKYLILYIIKMGGEDLTGLLTWVRLSNYVYFPETNIVNNNIWHITKFHKNLSNLRIPLCFLMSRKQVIIRYFGQKGYTDFRNHIKLTNSTNSLDLRSIITPIRMAAS